MHKDGSLPKLFISYSKEDIAFQKSLLKHLASLRNKIVTWHDQDLLPGEEWDDSIKAKLRSADVVLYLVTHNSIATEYIQEVELPIIEERCRNKECVLIPVIVDFCLWEDLDFAKYNALPNKGLPVTDKSWVNQNEAWLKVVQGIKKNIEKLTVDSSITQPSIAIPEQKPVITSPVFKANDDWQIIDHYKVKEGLAIDTITGLMWLRFAFGQTWENGIARGHAQQVNWDNAFKTAKDFNKQGDYADYNDWRLPTIDELKTLSNEDNYIHPYVFPKSKYDSSKAVYWSSSLDALTSYNERMEMYFVNGSGHVSSSKDGNYQVRLVRSG
jgi:Protein of unknown function (DUF1566)/TIR domain